jgi:hypothetical protein
MGQWKPGSFKLWVKLWVNLYSPAESITSAATLEVNFFAALV